MPAIIYALAFTGGFVIMSLELLGGRVLAPYFGSSVYVWGSIITVFMLCCEGHGSSDSYHECH